LASLDYGKGGLSELGMQLALDMVAHKSHRAQAGILSFVQ